jgi:hypothetical protein
LEALEAIEACKPRWRSQGTVLEGIARQTAGLPDSFVLATAALQFLGYFFLDRRAPKK